jgi:endonuclease YncB( thermonuclease family)
MQSKRLGAATILAGWLAAAVAHAQTAPAQHASIPIFDFPQSGVEFETGDTWRFGNQTFRLYGVQSCIRGTTFTNSVGVKRDCGEASLAYAAALIRDVRPRCTAIARAGAPPVIYTVCAAHVGQNTLDLGTILITEGWAFAATDGNGKPIIFDYAVAEREAQKARRGLWAAPDLPDPTQILLDAARSATHP